MKSITNLNEAIGLIRVYAGRGDRRTQVGHVLVDPDVAEKYGDRLWFRTQGGYVFHNTRKGLKGRSQANYLYRLILGLQLNDGLHGEHLNGDRLDCRRSNLVAVTPQENAWLRVYRCTLTPADPIQALVLAELQKIRSDPEAYREAQQELKRERNKRRYEQIKTQKAAA